MKEGFATAPGSESAPHYWLEVRRGHLVPACFLELRADDPGIEFTWSRVGLRFLPVFPVGSRICPACAAWLYKTERCVSGEEHGSFPEAGV